MNKLYFTESAPKDNTALSDNSFTSSPATISLATDNPPSVCSEPSVVDVASVVSSVIYPIVPDTVNKPAELKDIFSALAHLHQF